MIWKIYVKLRKNFVKTFAIFGMPCYTIRALDIMI